MKKFSKIFIIIALPVLLFLIGYMVWYFYNYNSNKKDDFVKSNIIKEINNKEILALDNEVDSLAENRKPDENIRQYYIKYIQSEINNLAPFDSEYNIYWDVKRFAFVSNNNFYVEYTDGHVSSRMLLNCKEDNSGSTICHNIAFFIPENFLWDIQLGNDYFTGRTLDYYEQNKNKLWKKIGTSDTITYFPASHDVLIGLQTIVDLDSDIWRLDPVEVTKNDIPDYFQLDTKNDKYNVIQRGEGWAEVKISHLEFNYIVYLIQPVKMGERGMWVIEKIVRLE